MKITRYQDAPRAPFKLEAYIVSTSPTVETVHICLQPGEEIGLHSNPFDVTACLLYGQADLLTETGTLPMPLYAVADIEAGELRGFKNSVQTECRILVIKKF